MVKSKRTLIQLTALDEKSTWFLSGLERRHFHSIEVLVEEAKGIERLS
jgi:hypothetical protein